MSFQHTIETMDDPWLWEDDDKDINRIVDVHKCIDKLVDQVVKDVDDEPVIVSAKVDGRPVKYITDLEISKIRFGLRGPKPKRNYTKHEDIRCYLKKKK